MGAHKRALHQAQDRKRAKRRKKYNKPSKGLRQERLDRNQELVRRERDVTAKEKMYKKLDIRQPVLEQAKTIWLTPRGYRLLRQEKRRKNLSMAQILDDLLLETLGKDESN